MNSFAYSRPTSIDEASGLLAADPEARLLAGGMTLVATMKMRLAKPTHLVDLAGVPGLCGISCGESSLVVGAMTTHAEVAASPVIRERLPALATLAGAIGDPQVRNRGTIGGSIANSDPSADYPAALVGLAACVLTQRRAVAAGDFFRGMFETILEPGEIVTGVEFPWPQVACYEKFRSPASRYALVGVFMARSGDAVRVAVTGAAPSVFRAEAIEAALRVRFAPEALATVRIASDGLNSDMHGDAQFRAHLVGVLARRAVGRLAMQPAGA